MFAFVFMFLFYALFMIYFVSAVVLTWIAHLNALLLLLYYIIIEMHYNVTSILEVG